MRQQQLTGNFIIGAGMLMAIAGLVVIAVADPLIGGVLFIVGASDMVVGQLFRSGRLGMVRSVAAEDTATRKAATAAQAEADANAAAYGTTADGTAIEGDANPYARED